MNQPHYKGRRYFTNQINLAKHKFTLLFNADTELPLFIGNTVRGALGNALDRINSPAYEKVFKIESEESVPNPYIISIPYPSREVYKNGDTLTFYITLFGDACNYNKDIIRAVNDMCRGKFNGCSLDDYKPVYNHVWNDEGVNLIPPVDSILIRFLTPVEVLSSKQAVIELSFDIFIESLFGRINNLLNHYTMNEFVIPYSLIARKPFIINKYSLTPINFQTNGQPIKGFIGTIKYFGDITRYLPYIDLGSQIHIGKKTTRGCGQYSFEI